ncbi:MAG TPA: Holliday junction resolvase RuvX [Ignavibacteriales bacterium]|nr:Holliday junction resolvase RuvX [Ignavibacteriales bacterium]
MEEKRLLAIDYGLKRIGLALSDPLGIFAYPFDVISNDETLWPNLEKIIKDNGIFKIVLGLPYRENGEKSHITDNVLEFKTELENKTKLPVILWDETYSSQKAMANIIEGGVKKKKRRDKTLLDKGAAAVILSEYMNSSLG